MKIIPAAAAFILLFAPLFTQEGRLVRLSIFHVNDTHDHIVPFKNLANIEQGGAARRMALIRTVRAQNPDLLVLDAGDTIRGGVYGSLYRGAFAFELMNAMGYSYMTVGNHEFDYGVSNLIGLKDKAKFGLLSANIFYKNTDKPVFTPCAFTNIAGVRIAVIGLTHSDTNYYATMEGVNSQVDFKDELAVLSNYIYVKKLKETNDLLICLTHIGIDKDKKLAAVFPQIDVIVGGHSHTDLPKPVLVGRTIIVQAGEWGKKAGLLDLYLDEGTVVSNHYTYFKIGTNIGPDRRIADMIAKKDSSMKFKLDEPVLRSDVFLGNPALANFTVDALCGAGKTRIAILGAGFMNENLNSGVITLRDLYQCYPFDDHLATCTITGKLLREIVRKGILAPETALYVSAGVSAVLKKDGGLVVTVDGVPLDDGAVYTLSVNDRLLNGAYGITEFGGVKDKKDTGLVIRDLMADRLGKLGTITKGMVTNISRIRKE